MAPEMKKGFVTSVPEGTTHIMLNATLGPSQKTLAAKFPEAACTHQIRRGRELAIRQDQ